MGDYFAFRRMVTPWLVRILYIIGVVILIIVGLAAINNPNVVDHSKSVMIGLAIMTLGNLAWRVLCEGIIVLFSIHEAITCRQHHRPERAITTNPAIEAQSSGWVCAKCEQPLSYADGACPNCKSPNRKWVG